MAEQFRKRNETSLISTLLFLIFYLSTMVTAFAEIQVKTELSGSTLYLGDEITLQVKVDGAKQGVMLEFPKVPGLHFRQIGRPSSSSQTVIMNGKVNSFSGMVFNVGISADRKGSYQVPGIKATLNSETARGNGFQLRVIAPGQQSSMKIKTILSRSTIYQQEYLDITVKWYLQTNVNDYNFRFPLLDQKDKLQLELLEQSGNSRRTNLTVSNYKVPFQQKEESLNGESYSVYFTTFRVAPTEAGEFLIPRASVKAMIQVGTELKRDFFDRLVRRPKLDQIFATSQEKKVIVQPLPTKDRPESFTGAVGQYSIKLSANNNRVKVGDPIELSIRITGKGQLHKIEQPLLSEQDSFKRNFVIVDNLQPGDIQGKTILFKQTVRAKRSDVTEIPSVTFSYFDTKQKKYITIHSNSLPLKVLETERVKSSDIIVHTGEKSAPSVENFQEVRRGLHANYVFEDALKSQGQSAVWLLFLLFPPIGYAVSLVLINRQRKLQGNQALVRSRSAKGVKDKRMKQVEKLIDDEKNSNFYQELSKALSGFLSDRLNLGHGELTVLEIRNLKAQKKLPDSFADEFTAFMENLDRLRFTNQSSSSEEKKRIFEDGVTLMKQVEKRI